MRIGILGPLYVRDTEIHGARLRVLLVRFALSPGRVITAERLIDDLWAGDPPVNPTNALQSLVSRLRRELPGMIVSHPAGYLLDLPPEAVDAWVFERLTGEARAASGDPALAASLLREALSLWRGKALADASDMTFAAAPATRLEELRLSALRARFDADLALARGWSRGSSSSDLVAELEEVVAEHPLREPFHAQLVLALLAEGRRADALEAFERIRLRLADQLGMDPGPELRAAHLTALRDEPPRTATAPHSGTPSDGSAIPHGDISPHDRNPVTRPPDNSTALPSDISPHDRNPGPPNGGMALPGDISPHGRNPVNQPPDTTALPGDISPVGRRPVAQGDASLPVGNTAPWAQRSSPGPRGNLPARLTSFVGRQADLARLGGLLESARLVTLTGPGGAGKTRLAIETAATLDVPDGVWLVELSSLSDPSDVAAAVRTTLVGGLLTDHAGAPWDGMGPAGPPSPLEWLASALRDRSPVLVLDNCEHVIGGVARVADRLLAAAGGLRIIATSREPLDITGESLHPVLPLGLPAPDAGVEEALACPAVALFADRAAAALPGLRVDGANVSDVVRVCRELDGIPLAIELAAARLRSLTAGQLADMIGDRLAFRGSRTAQPRHRTLRAVIDWSWDLLGADEQALLRRMSVFSGGATMETVRRVCGHGVDQITSLVDRSLVTISPEKRESPPGKREGGSSETHENRGSPKNRENDGFPETHENRSSSEAREGRGSSKNRESDGFPETHEKRGSPETREGGGVRYRLLETLRQYAAEKLEEAGEADRVRAEHALHFVELLEAAGPSLRTGDQLRELAMIDAEQGNLDAALDHAISSGDGDLALRMIMARLWPWVMRGRHREAGKWAAAVLEAVGDEAPRGREMAHALCVLIAPAEPYPARTRVVPPELLRALRTLREADHPAALGSWAIAGGYVGVTDDVLEQSSAMTEMFAGHPDPWTRATARLVGGIVEFEYGRAGVSRAESLLWPALDGYRLTGDRWGLSFALYWLSLVAENRGDSAEALSLLEESVAPATEIGGLETIPGPIMLRVRLGQLRLRTGDLSGAETELDRAGEAMERAGDVIATARVRHARGELARWRGELGEAEALLREALELVRGQAMASPQLIALINIELARVLRLRGEPDLARSPLRHALESIASSGDQTVRASVLEGAAEWFASIGDWEGVAVLIGAAYALRGITRTSDPVVASLDARAAEALGEDRHRAAHHRGAALPSPESFALTGTGEEPRSP